MADRPDPVTPHPASLTCSYHSPTADGKDWPFVDRWRSEAAIGLARGIRAEQAFDRMPILADALEEAGCDDPVILDHCRCCPAHVMGCWVVEAVLTVNEPRQASPQPQPTVFGRVVDGMREELRLTNWFRVTPAASVVPPRERAWARMGCGLVQTLIFVVITILVLILCYRLLPL